LHRAPLQTGHFLGRQTELDFAERPDLIRDNQGVVVLEEHLDAVAEVGALGEEHQVLQREHALDDVIRILLLDVADAVRVLAHNRLLLREIPLASEHELVVRALDFYQIRQIRHVAADFLEVARGDVDDRRELRRRHFDLLLVEVEQVELEIRHGVLVAVLDANAQPARVGLGDVQGERLVVVHGLHELEQVQHVDADDNLLGAVVVLELRAVQSQVHQHRVAQIHGDDPDPRRIEFDVRVGEYLLERLNQDADNRRLNRFEFQLVQVGAVGDGFFGHGGDTALLHLHCVRVILVAQTELRLYV
jgi:hypothetical protein